MNHTQTIMLPTISQKP